MKKDLSKPRFELIADYPGNTQKVGSITIEDATASYFRKFPNNFRELQWWEKVDEKDMPQFLKQDDRVYKVSNWRHEKSLLLFDILDYDAYKRGSGWSTFNQGGLRNFLPATEEDYLEYNAAECTSATIT